MKTRILALSMALLLLCSGMAAAQTFTHPETGEEVTLFGTKSLVYDNIVYDSIPRGQTVLGASAEGRLPLVDALQELATAYEAQLDADEIENVLIDHLDELFTGELLAQVLDLPLTEQSWALLYSMDLKEAVRNAPAAQTFSDELNTVFDQIDQSPEEVELLNIERYFPVATVAIDGKEVRSIAITLLITELGGAQRYERYSFVEIAGTWMFNSAYISQAN